MLKKNETDTVKSLCPQFQSQFKDTITERGGKSMLAQSPNSTCKCGEFCV